MDESVSSKLFVKKINIKYKTLSLTNECHDCWCRKSNKTWRNTIKTEFTSTADIHLALLGSANSFQALFQKIWLI